MPSPATAQAIDAGTGAGANAHVDRHIFPLFAAPERPDLARAVGGAAEAVVIAKRVEIVAGTPRRRK